MFEAIGAVLDKLIMIAAGAYALYFSAHNKEKLGEKKAKWLRIGGVVLILLGILKFFAPISG